jgi:rRNA-processing protein FCF1
MEKILLDTNLWLALAENGVDVISEAQNIGKLYLSKKVFEELKEIAKNTKESKKRKYAKMALEAIYKNHLEGNLVSSKKAKNADSELLELSLGGFIIATNDKILIAKIRKRFGIVAVLRQKKKIKLLGEK